MSETNYANSRSKPQSRLAQRQRQHLRQPVSGVDPQPAQLAELSPEPPVSPNNPCPFLRALVAGGHISGHVENLSRIAGTIVAAGGATPSEPRLPKSKVYLIA